MALLASIIGSAWGKDLLKFIITKVFHVEQTADVGGTFKFQAVYEAVLQGMDVLVKAGKLSAVNQEEVKAIIELIVQVLNGMGLLKGSVTTTPVTMPKGTIVIKGGTLEIA